MVWGWFAFVFRVLVVVGVVSICASSLLLFAY